MVVVVGESGIHRRERVGFAREEQFEEVVKDQREKSARGEAEAAAEQHRSNGPHKRKVLLRMVRGFDDDDRAWPANSSRLFRERFGWWALDDGWRDL